MASAFVVATLLAGCTAPAPSRESLGTAQASVSSAVQKVLDVVHSDMSRQLLEAADRYDQEYCEVHFRRTLDTPERDSCIEIRDQLAGLADQLESDLKRLQPVPAELDEMVSMTTDALASVRVLAKPNQNPELLTFTLKMVRGALGAW